MVIKRLAFQITAWNKNFQTTKFSENSMKCSGTVLTLVCGFQTSSRGSTKIALSSTVKCKYQRNVRILNNE